MSYYGRILRSLLREIIPFECREDLLRNRCPRSFQKILLNEVDVYRNTDVQTDCKRGETDGSPLYYD